MNEENRMKAAARAVDRWRRFELCALAPAAASPVAIPAEQDRVETGAGAKPGR